LLQRPSHPLYQEIGEEQRLDITEKMNDVEFTELTMRTKQSREGCFLKTTLYILIALLFIGVSFQAGKTLSCRPHSSNSFVPFSKSLICIVTTRADRAIEVPIRKEMVFFTQQKEWFGPSFESDALWDEVINNSEHRFIQIQDPKDLNVPLGMTRPGDKDGVKHGFYYSIGMHHQLHCLVSTPHL
jgi:hypothetical protein